MGTDSHLDCGDGDSDSPIPDQISIEYIFRAYAPDCYRFALRIVRDRDLAHDIVQDVFEVLVRHPESFEPGRGGLLSWLMTLTHNKAVDLIRWRQRHVRLDVGGLEPNTRPAGSGDTLDFAQRSVERVELVEALSALSDDEREVLVLTHYAGLTQVEIAHETGVPLGTVKSRARLGMQRMRRWMESDLKSA